MKALPWLIAGVAVGVAVYVVSNSQQSGLADGLDQAAGKLGGFGAKQRVTGTGGGLMGKVKEGVGSLTGDKSFQGEGLVDQAVGAVKDTIGDGAISAAKKVFEGNHS